eukprot:c6128_g1_i1 orf=57-365(-)
MLLWQLQYHIVSQNAEVVVCQIFANLPLESHLCGERVCLLRFSQETARQGTQITQKSGCLAPYVTGALDLWVFKWVVLLATSKVYEINAKMCIRVRSQLLEC